MPSIGTDGGGQGSRRKSHPGKRVLKSTILWCARWLVAECESHAGQPYPGPIRVQVEAKEIGETQIVRSVRDFDGFAPPPPSLAGEESEEPGVAVLAGVSRSELLRVLLSDDERAILRGLAEKGPCKAAGVFDTVRGKVSENAFWTLWKNLQVRGLVDQDDRDGLFRVAVEWVKGLVADQRSERSATS